MSVRERPESEARNPTKEVREVRMGKTPLCFGGTGTGTGTGTPRPTLRERGLNGTWKGELHAPANDDLEEIHQGAIDRIGRSEKPAFNDHRGRVTPDDRMNFTEAGHPRQTVFSGRIRGDYATNNDQRKKRNS
ncbi:MAG: hypothetical protein Q4C47_08595 [Planctomycetia bacterium]|nr:hypothetical protein [Planctomycetia bacterium]